MLCRYCAEIVTKYETIEKNWRKSDRIDDIKDHLYQSSGNTLTKLVGKFPVIYGKVIQGIVKDTYDFGLFVILIFLC